MSGENIKAGVNGYGVIGKRVADAVLAQPDMELVGIADVVTDYRIKTAAVRGLPIYCQEPRSLHGRWCQGGLPGGREAQPDGPLIRGAG